MIVGQSRRCIFRFFLFILRLFFLCRIKISKEDKVRLRNLKSKVIVANHPSILDIVVLMSVVPDANCIVGQQYVKSALGGVIKKAFILNSLEFDELCQVCRKNIEAGSNIIIFPEGTRTPREGNSQYKKGAARVALSCGADIQPLLIWGSDKFGLQKNNPFWSFNHLESYVYEIIPLDELKVSEYEDLPRPAAAKRLTGKIMEEIKAAAEEYRKISRYRTFNMV